MGERLLGVLTAMKGRHNIAGAMLRTIPARLRGWRTLTVVIMDEGDTEEMRPIFESLHLSGRLIVSGTAPNSPLTKKWQRGLDYLKACGLDAVCIMGSDDIASAEYWQAGVDRIDGAAGPFGVRSCWMLDTASGRMGEFSMGSPERTVGCGRFYPRLFLNAIGWQLWDTDLDRGIDGAAEMQLEKFGLRILVEEIPGLLVDIKSPMNLNGFGKFMDFMGAGLNRFDRLLEREDAEKMIRDAGLADEILPLIGAA